MTNRVIASSEHNPHRQEVEESGDPEITLDIAYRFAEKLHAKDKRIARLEKALQRRTELHEHYKQRCEVMSETLDRVDRSIEQVKKVLSGE